MTSSPTRTTGYEHPREDATRMLRKKLLSWNVSLSYFAPRRFLSCATCWRRRPARSASVDSGRDRSDDDDAGTVTTSGLDVDIDEAVDDD